MREVPCHTRGWSSCITFHVTSIAAEHAQTSAYAKRALTQLTDQARHHLVVPFVGAGASANTGLPDWEHLVAPLAQELRLDHQARLDLVDVAQWYADTHG